MSSFLKTGQDLGGINIDSDSQDINIENESNNSQGNPEGAAGPDAQPKPIDEKVLSAVLKAVDKGIEKGIGKGLGSSDSVGDSIISGMFRGLALLTGSTGDLIERKIKTKSKLEFNSEKVNEESRKGLSEFVIRPSLDIYRSNFSEFKRLVDESFISKNNGDESFGPALTNNTSETKVLIVEFKSLDDSVRFTSDQSPYKVILKDILPLLKSKFDAIASFKEKVGAGSNIDYAGVSQRLGAYSAGSGDDSSVKDDLTQLRGLYRAIDDWRQLINGLSSGEAASPADTAPDKESDSKSENDESNDSDAGSENNLPPFKKVLDGIEIFGVRPVANASMGMNPGEIIIDKSKLDPTTVPVISILLRGPMAKYVKPVGKDMDYFLHFVRSGDIKARIDPVTSLPRFVSRVSSESTSDGAKLSVYFDTGSILRETSKASDLVDLISINSNNGGIVVKANGNSVYSDLLKLSAASSTTPLYETISPSGERVAFTPADLVVGGGRLTDSKGNKFKVKKRKGKSLADRVNSSSFGKVKRGLK